VGDHGLPPAIPATNTKYQVKLAPSSNHALVNEEEVKKFHAVVGSEIARFAINIPLHPESTELIILDNFAAHSAVTNDAERINGEMPVRGIICIPCLYSMLLPK